MLSHVLVTEGESLKRYIAEAFGTAVLVLLGCGSVTLGGLGGLLGSGQAVAPLALFPIAFAFGLTVTAMAYCIGPVSGCHINPAVTAAVWSSGRMSGQDAIGYVIAQVIGGIVGAGLLYILLSGKAGGYDVATSGLGQNGWGPGYLGGYSVVSAFVSEVVLTLIFTAVILGATSKAGSTQFAGAAIGLTLAVLHVVFINVTGVSANPARSIGPALFVGGTALSQLWLFIVAPVIGGLIAGYLFKARILEQELGVQAAN
jgi:aquaporin Z